MGFTAESERGKYGPDEPMDSSIAGSRSDITPKWDDIQIRIIICEIFSTAP